MSLKCLFFGFLMTLLGPLWSWAQPNLSSETTTGNVTWKIPTPVQDLEVKSRKLTEQPGYRIQIFLGSLDEAKKFRQDYIFNHPGALIYLSQNIPDHVLRLGNFLSKAEAKEALKEVRREIPSAFIVDDLVEPPRIEIKENGPKD
ncbi:MAG: hypothetical protein RLY35_1281 [Bacteroidota bacterium]|jgi:hypothetical protein